MKRIVNEHLHICFRICMWTYEKKPSKILLLLNLNLLFIMKMKKVKQQKSKEWIKREHFIGFYYCNEIDIDLIIGW